MISSTKSIPYSYSVTCKAIIKTLVYFDIFHFPLLVEEMKQYLSVDIEIEDDLITLVNLGIINRYGNYYGIENVKGKISRRTKGKTEADKCWKTAKFAANILSIIPFIRCICISGSLSKDYMDQNSDIDYFIIVKENRLWIVKAIFSFFILGFGILNIKKYFCPNYIIVDTQLEIEDKNIFTATEICSLVPLYNEKFFSKFRAENEWVTEFIPNPKPYKPGGQPERKHLLHLFWNSSIFEAMDKIFFKIYRWHFGKKFKNLKDWNLSKLDVKVQKNSCKMHTTGHRGRILSLYDDKIEKISKQFHIDFTQKYNG